MLRFRKIAILFLLSVCISNVYGQTQPATTPYFVDEGDTVFVVNLPVVDIYAYYGPEGEEALKKYMKLRRDVLRAYPYAKLAARELKYVNDSIAKIKRERERKKFIKAREKELKAQLEKDLRSLTYNQGRILIKLVDRETGNSSYSLVKEMRGGLNAFFWQTLARFYGANLKSRYEPEGEDRIIEHIVQQIERGELKPVQRKPPGN